MARFCPSCGATAGDEDRFCGSCGKGMGSAASAGAAPTASAASGPAGATGSTAAIPATQAALIEETYRKVGDHLRAAGYKFMENAPDKTYTALAGSAAAFVKIVPAGTDDTWVTFVAPVVSGARVQQDLLEFLLHKNAEYAATKLHLTDSNEIWLQYSVFGSIIDANTTKLALGFALMAADQLDDEIRNRWGGKRASEVLASA